LGAAADGSPVREGFETLAVFPAEAEELSGVEVSAFVAEKGFEAPLNIRAVPGLKAIATSCEPIELEEVPHGRKRCR
jgi:hypothetical protein